MKKLLLLLSFAGFVATVIWFFNGSESADNSDAVVSTGESVPAVSSDVAAPNIAASPKAAVPSTANPALSDQENREQIIAELVDQTLREKEEDEMTESID